MITIRVMHLFVHLHQIRPGPATVCINKSSRHRIQLFADAKQRARTPAAPGDQLRLR